MFLFSNEREVGEREVEEREGGRGRERPSERETEQRGIKEEEPQIYIY